LCLKTPFSAHTLTHPKKKTLTLSQGWGFAACVYDRGGESALAPADDVVASDVLREVLDFVEASPALSRVAATRTTRAGPGGGSPSQAVLPSTFLLGHSRGGKLAVLAAARDAADETLKPPRIAALGLIDPVNNTAYAPQGPRFPSATAALIAGPPALATLPVAIVGGGWAADCAPADANYDRFYASVRGPAWMAVLPGAGHLAFAGDHWSESGSGGSGSGGGGDGGGGSGAPLLQRALCAEGPASGEAVRAATAGAMAAWCLAVWSGGVGAGGGVAQAPPAAATKKKKGQAPPPPPPFPTAAWMDAAQEDMAGVLGGRGGLVVSRKGGV
jgi:hypothetical protein